MTQKDKQLLLKDLCARLPYGVLGQCEIDASYDTEVETIPQTHKFKAVAYGFNEDKLFVCPMIENQDELEIANEEIADGVYVFDFKPYLFPLSSMTEKQEKEYNMLRDFVYTHHYEYEDIVEDMGLYDNWKSIDYLNANHFDYRGLIEKGLAIDATGLNIY